jgi:hypothetical protein
MRGSIRCALFVSVAAIAPAMAEPVVKADMPAIRASISNEQMTVRLDQGLLGTVNSLKPRTVLVSARDASGRVVQEQEVQVSRRMTYARFPVSAAMSAASTVLVSVR